LIIDGGYPPCSTGRDKQLQVTQEHSGGGAVGGEPDWRWGGAAEEDEGGGEEPDRGDGDGEGELT
jgi:hypothetical protein